MASTTGCVRPLLSCLSLLAAGLAQDGAARAPGAPEILLQYGTFDPLLAVPEVPPALRAGTDTNLWIVQFRHVPDDGDRDLLRGLGGTVVGYLPHVCHVVRLPAAAVAGVRGLPPVRWLGAYEPAYRLEPALLAEHLAGGPVPERRYNLVMADKRRDKAALAAKIAALGGRVVDRHEGGLLFTVDLGGAALLRAARLDEVLWIDRWTEIGVDMNNARNQGGASTVEAIAGYTGAGVRGHVYEGLQQGHPDFNTPPTNVLSGGEPQRHGHCTAGIVFGNGTSHASARGMAPDAIAFFTNYATVTPGFSRNAVLGEVVGVHQCMFTTASWGNAQTTAYTSVSADADDIVFDHRIPWTNSMSNLGNQNARPQAWAKNVISVGAVQHFNNSLVGDDSWLAGNASIGPAADGRIKPDLVGYYDQVWTSDLATGVPNNDASSPGTTGGYNNNPDPGGLSYTGFGGTSAATPIVAGLNALAIQMFTDHLFDHPGRVVGGTRFENRPYAPTLKALMIAGADQYPITATDNRREHVGWGFPNLANLYSRRNRISVVPEDAPLLPGATHSYQLEVLAGETSLRVCLSWLDPAGNPAAAFTRVNDLTLRVVAPGGTAYWGNAGLAGPGQGMFSVPGGSADTIDTVECVLLPNPVAGTWTIEVSAPTLTTDTHPATPATDATYALVMNGGRRLYGSGCARYLPDPSPASAGANLLPFGGHAPATLTTSFAGGASLVAGGTVFVDVTVTSPMYLTALDLNTTAAAGIGLHLDVYRTAAGQSHVGRETDPTAWLPVSAGHGVAAGANVPSAIELAQPLLLAPGSYGLAIHANDFGHAYTVGNGGNQTHGNADLLLVAGTAKTGPPGAAGTVFAPRVLNAALHYRRAGDAGTNVRWQTILRRDELGAAGAIRGLAFASPVSGRHWNESLLVRMSHVPAGHSLATIFAANLPTPFAVLDAANYSFRFTAGQWAEIGLQTPFAYDGVSDVVVDVVARGNWQTTPGGFHDRSTPRVYATSWSTAPPASGTFDVDEALRLRVAFDCAGASEHGSSCGRLRAGHVGDGRRGALFQFRVTGAGAGSLAALAIGYSNAAPLPLSLSPLGWTNCFLFDDAVQLEIVPTDLAGAGAWSSLTPDDPTLDGVVVYGQWFALDPGEPGGVTWSDYTRVIVGVAP